MRKKICQIIPTLVQGGAEKQMSLLARNLDPQRFESHVIVLTHSGPLEEELRQSDVHLHFIEKRGKLDPFAVFRLTSKLRKIQPDVVHTWLFAANSYGRAAAKWAGVPVVVAGERCVDPWKKWWHHAIDRRLAKQTAAIATNTAAVQDFNVHHGIEGSKFVVIPNAVVPPQQTKMSRQNFFSKLGIPPRGKIVGAVGRLWEQKGYKDLIWAGELLRVAYEDVWFVIIGDGPDRDKLLHYRDLAKAHHAVRLVGHRNEVASLMGCFDVLWNGSLYEGQSNTILEAMSMGIPVVASDIPGNRDLVIPQETGLLFPLGDVDTLTRQTFALLKDDARREKMGENARKRIRTEFTLERMVRAYEELYLRL